MFLEGKNSVPLFSRSVPAFLHLAEFLRSTLVFETLNYVSTENNTDKRFNEHSLKCAIPVQLEYN